MDKVEHRSSPFAIRPYNHQFSPPQSLYHPIGQSKTIWALHQHQQKAFTPFIFQNEQNIQSPNAFSERLSHFNGNSPGYNKQELIQQETPSVGSLSSSFARNDNGGDQIQEGGDENVDYDDDDHKILSHQFKSGIDKQESFDDETQNQCYPGYN